MFDRVKPIVIATARMPRSPSQVAKAFVYWNAQPYEAKPYPIRALSGERRPVEYPQSYG
jgi:GDP-D-mannose dehydratase